MLRRRFSAVSKHEVPSPSFETRAKGALLRMRSKEDAILRALGLRKTPFLRASDTDLILRSLRSKRLEGWRQRTNPRPSFETHAEARSAG
jgi:hypothetical protein